MQPITLSFWDQVQIRPEAIAIHHRGRDVTYGQLAANATAFSAWLAQADLKRGDRVALLLGNSPEYVACYLGALQAGCTVVALNEETMGRELAATLKHAAPRAVAFSSLAAAAVAEAASVVPSLRVAAIANETDRRAFPSTWQITCLNAMFADAGQPLVVAPDIHHPALDDIAQIIFTSGTTGRPKGVTLSHRNVAANCRSIVEYLELSHRDSALVALPFTYSYGNSLLFTHLAVGGRLVVASDFVFWSRVLDLMQKQQVTGFSGVPSSFAMLLHKSDFARREYPHLRYLTCAGGGLAPAVVQQLRTSVPHVQLYLMYGQTEATARLSTLLPNEIETKIGSIGRGIPGVELRVLDEQGEPSPPGEVGEIVARGDNIMVGYWNDEAATREVLRPEGLRTGDLARQDEDGYIYIVGRRSDMIKSGAYRINPKEIEEIIVEMPGIAEVAVAGLPDPILGETPVAFIVASPKGNCPSEDEIMEHCRKSLPRYKLIRAVRFVNSLPKTSSGKIKRQLLSAEVS